MANTNEAYNGYCNVEELIEAENRAEYEAFIEDERRAEHEAEIRAEREDAFYNPEEWEYEETRREVGSPQKRLPVTKDTEWLGKEISILTDVATAHCTLATTHIHGKIDRETEKAVKVGNEKGFCWFPKSALKAEENLEGIRAEVKPWFNLDKWHYRLQEEPSILSA